MRILNVARCTSHKCQSDLLKACAILRANGVPVEATLVGDGPLRKDLEAQAGKLKLAESVTFLGAIPQDRMKSLYSNYDLLAIASESEGLPVALLEAMASRLPVIAPDAPYVTELAPNAAEMIGTFRLHDPDSLAALVSQIAASPDTAARRERIAWEWVQGLTWDDVATKEWEEMAVAARSLRPTSSQPSD